jgi:hypothetical protein
MGARYGNYSSDNRQSSKNQGPKMHPVWRGVGFAFMILIPVMAFATMRVVMDNNFFNRLPLTPDMMAKPGQILYAIYPDPFLYIELGLFLLALFIYYVIFTLISFLITSMFGVSRNDDPFYVPPVRHTKIPPKRYRGG